MINLAILLQLAVGLVMCLFVAAGIITVKADVDFETTGAGGFKMVITVNDGSETQHLTTTGTVTFTIVNINEGITLTIGTPAISSDEVNMLFKYQY